MAEVNPHEARKAELELKNKAQGLDETETEELRKINEHLDSLKAKPAAAPKAPAQGQAQAPKKA